MSVKFEVMDSIRINVTKRTMSKVKVPRFCAKD